MKKSNRLLDETSPYLKQHAHNPVDWYPWGPEALDKARRDQKPIFLSIGYSACHWCHVMEHESFEDEETAKLMNESFINIKVDREERQDLDQIYMSAVQVMTQHGGWPMSVFLTPDLQPFYGGTYFPPEDRHGLPSFKKVLVGVATAWKTRRDELLQSASQLTDALKEIASGKVATADPSVNGLSKESLAGAVQATVQAFDDGFGGLGNAPKFFHSMSFRVCLRQYARTGDSQAISMVTETLEKIGAGGIYDHLGGGFHRYSTDRQWLVPHFEKMLYDNALLSELYLEAFQVTGRTSFAQTARETLDYVLREMTAPHGGFYSTQDADSEGVEGKFYVWSREEVVKLLDKDVAAVFTQVYNVSEAGNWDGHNILHRTQPLEEWARQLGLDASWLDDTLAVAKRKLLAERSKRIAPGRDEKVLVSWNAMMIESMARGFQVLGDERYRAAAQKAAGFILSELRTKRGTNPAQMLLLHCHKDGQGRFNAYLDDYAGLIQALTTLYETDADAQWLDAALDLANVLIDQFWDDTNPSFFFTARDHEKLITRPKDPQDGATPSGLGVAVGALLRLGKLTERKDLTEKAEKALSAHQALLRLSPLGVGQLLLALDFHLGPTWEIAVAEGKDADENEAVLQQLWRRFIPNRVLARVNPADAKGTKRIPWLAEKKATGDKCTVYICRDYTCQSPSVGAEALTRALTEMEGSK